MTEAEQEAREEQQALRLAADLKQMMATPGWGHVAALLSNRQPQVAVAGLLDKEQSADYTRGRYDEAKWIVDTVEAMVEQAAEIQQAAAEQRKISKDAVRAFLGHRGGGF